MLVPSRLNQKLLINMIFSSHGNDIFELENE